MNKSLRILLVEDLAADAELIKYALKPTLLQCQFLRVETESEFLHALEVFRPDVILSDYLLPEFDGLRALKLVQTKAPGTPLLIITGSISEDTAVDCMKAGAWDYVLKQHMKRLGSAILAALERQKSQADRAHAEERLKNSEARFAIAFQLSPVSMSITSASTAKYVEVNDVFLRDSGYSREEVIGHTSDELALFCDISDRERLTTLARTAGCAYCLEMQFRMKDGSVRDTLISTQVIQLYEQAHYLSTIIDHTPRKEAERKTHSQLEELQRLQNAMLGREDRVQELKREVNLLCRKLGEPVRYLSQEAPK